MPLVVTLKGIDQAISALNYRNKSGFKYRLIQAIRGFYGDEGSVESLKAIEQDELIKMLWDTGDDQSKIRNRRKNLSSIKSTVNVDLKSLYEDGKNPDGVIIGSDNIFEMCDEAKENILSAFADRVQDGAPVNLGQIADVLGIIDDLLSNTEAITGMDREISDGLGKLEDLKKLIHDMAEKVGVDVELEGSGEEEEIQELDKAEVVDDLEDVEIEEAETEDDLEDVEVEEDFEGIEDEDELEETGEEDGLQEVDAEDFIEEEEADKTEEDLEDVEVEEDLEGIEDEDELEETEEEDDLEEAGAEDFLEGEQVEEDLEAEETEEDLEDAEMDDTIEEVEVEEDLEGIEGEDELEETEEEDGLEEAGAEDFLEEEQVEEDLEAEEAEEDLEDVEVEEDFEGIDDEDELEEVEGLGAFPDGEWDKEKIEKARLLADEFDSCLAAMDKFYNQYILIPEGEYIVGSKEPGKDERPEHMDYLLPFYLGKFPVTNALFEIFVEKTGYKTTAEKAGYGTVYYARCKKRVDERTDLEKLIWNFDLINKRVEGACWYQPLGPGSTLHNKRNHPLVQVSLEDAMAFAAWAGKRLPTEGEWEAGSRTANGYLFPWGNERKGDACNIEESYLGDTTPVDKYIEVENDFGIVDTLGNALEWTMTKSERFSSVENGSSYYIAKGGSWISENGICLYSRFILEQKSCSNILGFRCVAY